MLLLIKRKEPTIPVAYQVTPVLIIVVITPGNGNIDIGPGEYLIVLIWFFYQVKGQLKPIEIFVNELLDLVFRWVGDDKEGFSH